MNQAAPADPAHLYLHEMDQEDHDQYLRRLRHLRRIVDTASDVFDDKDKTVSYRVELGNGDFHEVHVNIFTLPNSKTRAVHIWTSHSDGKSNFLVCDPIRINRPEIDLQNDDDILALIDLWISEANRAFARRGELGANHLQRVEDEEAGTIDTMSALIHAYVELGADEKFVVEVSINKPYDHSRFLLVENDDRLEFLAAPIRTEIETEMPSVIRLEYTRFNGMTRYQMGPMKPQKVTITAEDFPDEEILRRTVEWLKDIPEPHLLDEFVPVERD